MPFAFLAASFVTSALGSILNRSAQQKQAKATKKAALANLKLLYSDLNARAQQEQAAAVQSRLAVQGQGEALRGSAITGAASSNVAGNSVLAVLHDISRQESNATQTIDTNLTNTLNQIQRSKRGAKAQTEGIINGANAQVTPWWATGLQIGQAGLNAYGAYKGF